MSLSPDREGRLTASMFATAIGIGYDSRQKLYRQLQGLEPKFEGNDATEWGKENEGHAISAYEELTGEIVTSCGDAQGFYIHPNHDWLGCTPDGFTTSAVIEAKCPYSMNLYESVPAHYMPQVQGQMEITGKDKAHFICWTPEEIAIWEVQRSPEYWGACFTLLEAFWDCVQKGEEPKRARKPQMPEVEVRRIA